MGKSEFLSPVKEDIMKIVKTVMFVVVLLLAPIYALAANQGYMRISHIEGDVQIKTTDAEDWGYASINTPLAEGDEVWIPQDAKVELQLNTGTYIRLDQSSALQILSMDEDSSQFYLTQGYAYVFYDAPARGGVIQVDTPDASTRAFDNAVFRIDMSEQYTDVGVYKGYVETENNVGNTRINESRPVFPPGAGQARTCAMPTSRLRAKRFRAFSVAPRPGTHYELSGLWPPAFATAS